MKFAFLLVISLVSAAAFAVPEASETQAVVKKFRNESPSINQFLINTEVDSYRHHLDMAVRNIIATDPIARDAADAVDAELEQYVKDTRQKHLKSFFLLGNEVQGQQARVFSLVLQAAREQGFSEAAIKDMAVFTSASPTLNAYTYSPLIKSIDVVIFNTLLEALKDPTTAIEDPEALRGVIHHELTHIRAGHVRNAMILQAIFFASGKIMIPEEHFAAWELQWRDVSKQSIMSIIDGGHEPIVVATAASLVDLSAKVANSLVGSFGNYAQNPAAQALAQEKLAKLAESLYAACTDEALPSVSKAANEKPSISLGSFKAFRQAMIGLTRSQEITADRGALVHAGPVGVAKAMSALGGGGVENWRQFIKQGVNLQLTNAELRHPEDGDHPIVVMRAGQSAAFEQTANFKIISDPFSEAVYYYLILSKKLNESSQILSTGKGELTQLEKIREQRVEFAVFAKSLAKAIADEILVEVRNAHAASTPGEDPTPKTSKFFATLNRLREMPVGQDNGVSGRDLLNQADLVKSNRLFGYLYRELNSMQDANPANIKLAAVYAKKVASFVPGVVLSARRDEALDDALAGLPKAGAVSQLELQQCGSGLFK